jgi:hypothetical protein
VPAYEELRRKYLQILLGSLHTTRAETSKLCDGRPGVGLKSRRPRPNSEQKAVDELL